MTLSVVIPAYNEERRIAGTLERLFAEAESLHITEIIVVDDGSADRTADVVRGFAGREGAASIRLLQHERNSGKGAALRTGLLAAREAWVGFIDADMSVQLHAFTEAESLLSAGADIVVGKRVAPDGGRLRSNQPLFRRLMGHMFVSVQRRVVDLPFEDTQCPFKVLTRNAVEQVVPRCAVNGWAFDVELLRVALRQSLQVVEMPVHWSHIEGSSVRAGPRTAFNIVRELLAIRRADDPG